MPRPCRIRKQLNEFLFFFHTSHNNSAKFSKNVKEFSTIDEVPLNTRAILVSYCLLGGKNNSIFTCFWSCKKWSAKIPDTGEKSIAFFYWKSVTIETFFSFSTEYFFLNALKTTAVVIGTYYIPNYMQIFFKGTAVNVVLFCTQKVIGAQLPPLFKQCFSWIKERASFGYWFCMN